MKQMHFCVGDDLALAIEEAMKKWGFPKRSEFFRMAIIKFLQESQHLPTTFKEADRLTAQISRINNAHRASHPRADWRDSMRD